MRARKRESSNRWPILIIFGILLFFLIGGLSWSRPPVKDYRIAWAIDQARTVILSVYGEEDRYDDFNCKHEDMRALCEGIDTDYGPRDNKEPIIVHDAATNSQAVCIYSPINKEEGWLRKRKFWYCADNEGRAGYTDIDPGTPGYCVEGKSAVCPPFLEDSF